jgi:16S rRNA C967 or C1407 C5-methylase (RsmB/RsmF family)
VAGFLRDHPDFSRLPAQAVMAQAGLALPDTLFRDADFQPTPHVHGTDGFYGAVLQRA